MAKKNKPKTKDEPRSPEVSLVPTYSPLDVSKGIQAYRRGDVILYSIRGEPHDVLELIGELDKRGVDEVVALVSHRASDEEPDDDTGDEPDPGAGKRR